MKEYIGFISNMYEVCIDETQPIVRCRDCKYLWTTCGKHYCDLHYAFSIDLEDFCSRGERKGEK